MLSSALSGVCPNVDTLAAFNHGQLDITELEEVAEHISMCPRCTSVLEELDQSSDDDVLSKLRRLIENDIYVAEPGCQQLGSRARCLLQSSSERGVSTLPVAPQPKTTASLVGKMIGPYQVLATIRQGGMGRVYRALQVTLNRPVALKMVLSGAHAPAEVLTRFHREGEAIARLQHPNVVPIYDFGEHDGLPYYSMEFMEGGSLADRLAQGPLSCRDAAELVRTLALALAFAHQRQVLHRDLKPGNILLTRDGVPKIADFGLAKILDVDDNQTRSDAIMGTPAYMAPEQVEGKSASAGPAADIYALGVLLYETMTGKAPFRKSSRVETMDAIRFEQPSPPSRHCRIPRDLEAICLKCLEKTPGKRYKTAQDLADDLGRWLKGEPTVARPLRWPTRVWRSVKRYRVAAAVIMLTMLATAAFAVWRQPHNFLPEIEAELIKGKTVTLIPMLGRPTYARFRTGQDYTQTTVSRDGVFSVHTWSTCMLELLPDPHHDNYKLTAEIRHEKCVLPAMVGLFVAQQSLSLDARTECLASVLMTYNDVKSVADIVDLKAMNLPPPAGNQVRLASQYFCQEDRKTLLDMNTSGVRSVLFEPFRPQGKDIGKWRKLEIVVSPKRVKASWDELPLADYTAEMIAEQVAKGLTRAQLRRTDLPALNTIQPQLRPRGALGIYMHNGSASFRNVRVTPLF